MADWVVVAVPLVVLIVFGAFHLGLEWQREKPIPGLKTEERVYDWEVNGE